MGHPKLRTVGNLPTAVELANQFIPVPMVSRMMHLSAIHLAKMVTKVSVQSAGELPLPPTAEVLVSHYSAPVMNKNKLLSATSNAVQTPMLSVQSAGANALKDSMSAVFCVPQLWTPAVTPSKKSFLMPQL